MHEHLWMDSTPLLTVHGYAQENAGRFDIGTAAEARWNPGLFLDNYRLTDLDLIVPELEPYLSAGGRTIVDVTPTHLGRDPEMLRRIATATGVHVVMGTGYYLEQTHPAELARYSEDDIATEFIMEWRAGVASTGIRPGILGEIGTSVPVRPAEFRVLRAAANASIATGLAVTIHLHPWGRTGGEVTDALIGEGMRPDRIVLGHLNTAHDDGRYIADLLDRGVYLEFDLFGFDHSLLGLGRYPPSDADVAATVARLARDGHAARLLISHDIGVRTRLCAYGGWGYAHVLTHIVPLLRQGGLDEAILDNLLIDNPQAVLTMHGPPPISRA